MTSKQATRAVYGAFVLFVAVFVVSMIWQVARELFVPADQLDQASRSRPGTTSTVGPECGRGLNELLRVVDANAASFAAGSAARATSDSRGPAPFTRHERYPEIERVCNADPLGPDALAALARYERAADAAVHRQAAELSPVRIRAASFISGAQ